MAISEPLIWLMDLNKNLIIRSSMSYINNFTKTVLYPNINYTNRFERPKLHFLIDFEWRHKTYRSHIGLCSFCYYFLRSKGQVGKVNFLFTNSNRKIQKREKWYDFYFLDPFNAFKPQVLATFSARKWIERNKDLLWVTWYVQRNANVQKMAMKLLSTVEIKISRLVFFQF